MRRPSGSTGFCAGRGRRPSPRAPDPDRMRAEMAETRARGWAIDDEERAEGMRRIAAPPFNAFREAGAGVSISGPTVRATPARAAGFGALVREAADRIIRAVGGVAP